MVTCFLDFNPCFHLNNPGLQGHAKLNAISNAFKLAFLIENGPVFLYMDVIPFVL